MADDMQHDPKLIAECCQATAHLDGDLAEVGVWRGDSALCILKKTTSGTLFLYDTFCGMPSKMTIEQDYHRPGGWSDTSVEYVRSKLWEYAARVVIREGVFPDTAQDEGPFRFVHIDVDQYLSTKAALEWFVPRLVDGGIIVLDDYLCGSTPGAKRAADEFVRSSGEHIIRISGHRGVLTKVHTEATV